MLYLAWDRENNISLFFASPLYENEAPGLEQAAIVTLATRVLRPLKRAFLTLTLIIQLDSSVLKETINTFVFFNESFLEIETHIWHAPCTRKSNFTSRAFFRCFLFSFFIFLFFSRQNWLLTKLLFSSFFAFSPFFQKWFHTMSSVFIVATSKKTDDPCELDIWESNDGDQNNEKRVQFVMSTETELLFFITKCTGKARHSSKSFTESLTRSSSLW